MSGFQNRYNEVMDEKIALKAKVEQLERELAEAKHAYEIERDTVRIQSEKVADLKKQVESMKNCVNCENEGEDHGKEPLCHCSRLTVWKTAEEHLRKDMWRLKRQEN